MVEGVSSIELSRRSQVGFRGEILLDQYLRVRVSCVVEVEVASCTQSALCRFRVSSLVFVERNVGGSKLSVLET